MRSKPGIQNVDVLGHGKTGGLQSVLYIIVPPEKEMAFGKNDNFFITSLRTAFETLKIRVSTLVIGDKMTIRSFTHKAWANKKADSGIRSAFVINELPGPHTDTLAALAQQLIWPGYACVFQVDGYAHDNICISCVLLIREQLILNTVHQNVSISDPCSATFISVGKTLHALLPPSF